MGQCVARGQGMFSMFSAYLGLVCLAGYLLAVSNYAEISHGSRSLIFAVRGAWRRFSGCTRGKPLKRQIIRRELMIMVELRVNAASFFCFDKPFVLIVANIVLVLSANLLIMH